MKGERERGDEMRQREDSKGSISGRRSEMADATMLLLERRERRLHKSPITHKGNKGNETFGPVAKVRVEAEEEEEEKKRDKWHSGSGRWGRSWVSPQWPAFSLRPIVHSLWVFVDGPCARSPVTPPRRGPGRRKRPGWGGGGIISPRHVSRARPLSRRRADVAFKRQRRAAWANPPPPPPHTHPSSGLQMRHVCVSAGERWRGSCAADAPAGFLIPARAGRIKQ